MSSDLNSSKKCLHDLVRHRNERIGLFRQDPVSYHFIKRAIQDLCRDERFDVAAKNTRTLTVLDGLTNDIQILSKTGRRKFLHELDRTAKLDLKDDRKVAVGTK